jgi:hypothetical protein
MQSLLPTENGTKSSISCCLSHLTTSSPFPPTPVSHPYLRHEFLWLTEKHRVHMQHQSIRTHHRPAWNTRPDKVRPSGGAMRGRRPGTPKPGRSGSLITIVR